MFLGTAFNLEDLALPIIATSIFIDDDDGYTFKRFTEEWQKVYVKPIFESFIEAFIESTSAYIGVPAPDFEELQKEQIARDHQ